MQRKIKILHIALSYGGGVEIYIRSLIKYINKDKYENVLICMPQFKMYKLPECISEIYTMDVKREISPFEDLAAIIKTRKIIKAEKPDVIYCHSSMGGAVGRLAALGTKAVVMYNPHGWAFDIKLSFIKKNFYLFLEKMFAVITDRIICISNHEKNIALKNKITENRKLNVIMNGIDIDGINFDDNSQKNLLNSLGISDNACVIGCVARIDEQKGYDTFVKVAAEIKKTVKNVVFLWVGEGSKRKEFVELIDQYGLKNDVFITGWVDNVHKYIELFDVGVLFSKWEGFGLSVVELMVHGMPIVVSNVGGIPELIHNNKNGILVESENCEEISKVVINIINDVNTAKTYGENARKDAYEKFNVKRMVKETENIIDELLGW